MENLNDKAITNPVSAYFLTISKSSYESYFFRVREFCRVIFKETDFDKCEWSNFHYTDLLKFIQYKKGQNISPNSLNTSIAVIKSVALHAWQLDLISIECYMKIKLIRKTRGYKLPTGRALELSEIFKIKQQLFRRSDYLSVRDCAMFALGVGAGLRRNEIALLDVEHIKQHTLLVHGKGNKQRLVPLTFFIRQALMRWLHKAGIKQGAIFRHEISNERVSIQAVHRCCKRIVRVVKCRPFTAHDLRRTFATTLLDNNADVFAVQLLLGHSNQNTTRTYDRRGEKIKHNAIRLLPY